MTRDEILGQMRDAILTHGHQVRYIFPTSEGEGPPFFYTVGRSLFDKAELLMTGPLPQRVGGFILNEASRMIDAGELDPEVGEIAPDTLLEGFGCRIIQCDPVAAQMFGATAISGDDLTAYQIIWPDTEGRFPGEPDYDARYEQPLYPRSEHA